MADEDTEGILLQCVDAVSGVKIVSISHIVQHEHFNKFISKLRENIQSPTSFKDASPPIQSYLKEYFLSDDLVEFRKAESGDSKELMKLVLLLLYTAFIADKDIRTLLSNTLNHQLQLKLKYLFECIQKRASGLSVKYLDILIAENLEQRSSSSSSHGVRSNSSSGSRPWMVASPVVYTSSPKAAPNQSPLKELLQSPTFRIQRKLDSRVKDVKRLNKELHDLENEKAEWLVEKQVNLKKSAKLDQELQMLREQHLALRLDRDNLESRVLVGEDQNNEQAQKLGRELALARSETATLQQTLKEVMDKNDEISTKEEAIRSRLTSVLKERELFEMQLIEVREQHHLTTGLLDEKEHLLKQHVERIQDLELQLQESRPRSRPHNFTIESLDASQASPLFAGSETTTQAPSSPISHSGGENMGTAVVDLMLQETQQQLQALQEQHEVLQNKMQEVHKHNELTSKKLADSVQQCNSLHSQIDLMQVAKEQTNSELQTLSAKCEEQNCKLAELKQQRQQMERCVHERQEKLDQLQQQVLLGTEQLQQLRQQLEEKTTQLVESSHHAQGLSSQFEEVVKQKAGVERDYAETVSALKTENFLSLEQLKQATQLKVSQLEDNLLSTKSELSRVSELHASHSAALEEQQRRVVDTTHQLQATQQEVVELGEQRVILLRESQQQQQVLQDRLKDVTKEMEQKIAEKDKLLVDFKAELYEEIQEQKNSLAVKECENTRLAEKFSELKAESEQLASDAREKVEKLSKDREVLSNKLKESEVTMASQVNKANSELIEVKTALENKCREVESLTLSFESNVKNFKNELTAKDAIVQALNKSVSDLQKAVKAKECSLKQTKEEFKVQIETILQEKNNFITKVEEESSASKQNEKRFQEKVQLLESNRAKYEAELKAVESRIEGLRRDNEEKAAKLLAADSTAQKLKDELEHLSNQTNKNCTISKKAIADQQRLHQEELAVLKKELGENISKLTSKKECVEIQAKEEIASLNCQILKQTDELNEKARRWTHHLQEFKTKTVEFEELKTKLTEQVKQYDEIKSKSEEKISVLLNENETMRTEREAYLREKKDLLSHCERLEKEQVTNVGEINKINTDFTSMRVNLAEKDETIKNLVKNIENLKQNHGDTLGQKMNEYAQKEKTIKTELNNQIQSKMNELVTLNQKLLCKEQSIEFSLEKETESRKLLDELKSKLASTTEKNKSLCTEISDREQNVLLLQQEIGQAKEQLQLNQRVVKDLTENEKSLKDKILQLELENTKQQHTLVEELEERSLDAENNCKVMLEKQQRENDDLLESNKAELNKQISSLTEAVKLKEGVIISLMESVHDKDQEIFKNNLVLEEKIKVNEAASQRSLKDMEIQFKEEKSELLMKVKEATERVARMASNLSKKEEMLLQKTSAEEKNAQKCIELQNYIDKLKAKQRSIASDYTKQGHELELVQKDLTDFKHGCTSLKISLEKDKEEHKQALLGCESKHTEALKHQKELHVAQQQEVKTDYEKCLALKDRNMNVLQRQYEQLFQQNQAMEEEHSVKLSQLQSDLDTLKQESAQTIKRHKEECDVYKTDLAARQSEVQLLQNRIRDITMAQEMMRIDNSRSKKEYEGKIAEMKKKLQVLEIEKKTLEKNASNITTERDDVVRQNKELGELLAKKATEISEILGNHKNEIQLLKDEHNEHACFLEDKVSNLERSVDQLRKGGDSALQKCTVTYEEKIESLLAKHAVEVGGLNRLMTEKETNSSQEHKKSIAEYEDKICKINLQNEKDSEGLRKIITEMDNKLKVISISKTELESKMSKIKSETAAEIEKVNDIIADKESAILKGKDELEKFESVKNARIAELEGAVSAAKKVATALEEDRSSLEQAASKSASAKAVLNLRLLEAEEQVKVFRQRLQEQEDRALAQEKETKALEKQLQETQEMATAAQQLADESKSKADKVCHENKQLCGEREDLQTKVQMSAEETKQLREKLLQVEASLIDKEKECTAAKEDVMRVERVAENDVRSLKEEMTGLKKKYKDDKQAYADKMKTVFKDQIAKLMAEVEKYKTISDDCKLLDQKYEAAKHKLAQAYADLSDATTAKDDYYQQMNKYKEHVSRLRESVQKEQQQRQVAEYSCEPLRAQLAEAASALKRLQADKQSLEARLATADSKIRELNRNWSRESLGGPSNGSTIRAVVSESTLPSSSGAAGARDPRSSVSGRLGPDGRQQAGADGRRDPSATRTSVGGTSLRAGGTAFTASYRKAVGRASTIRGPSSSSAEDDVLDGSDVPLLTRNTRSASSVLPTSHTKGPDKAKSSDGLFRKPSIRITATDDRTKAKTPVELRALSSLLDEEDGEEGGDEELWEECEKKLLEEKEKKAIEGERKKKLALLRDHQARRTTVDGRIIKDEIAGNFSATPASGSKRRSLTRSVPRGLGTFFSCEDEDQEFFSNKYLQDMKVGRCVVNPGDVRMSELQRRNSLYPPHMRSSYAAEMQFNPLQDKLDPVTNMLLKEDAVKDLASATERLVIESPAFNLRKRKSLSDSLASNDSLETSLGKKVRRLSTSYSRPGPPTPGRKSIGRVDKENKRMSLRSHGSPSARSLASSISSSSLGSSRRVSRSPALSAVGSTPAAKSIGGSSSGSGGSPTATASASSGRVRGAPATPGSVSVISSRRHHHTPASIKRLIKGKSPWKKLTDGTETPKANSKLKIFRRPFGSKNYNVLSASQRVQEAADHSDSLNASTASSSRPLGSRRPQQNRTCQ